jgi:hypothetical protein
MKFLKKSPLRKAIFCQKNSNLPAGMAGTQNPAKVICLIFIVLWDLEF